MATVITMPRLSPTMEEGVLAKWLKKEGEKIAAGDLIAEVETDKANMDFPLEDDGVLLKQLATAGETVRLGAPVGILGEKGEDISALLAELAGDKAAGTADAAAAQGDAPAATGEEAAAAEGGEDPAAAAAPEAEGEAPEAEAEEAPEAAEEGAAEAGEEEAPAGKGAPATKVPAAAKGAPAAKAPAAGSPAAKTATTAKTAPTAKAPAAGAPVAKAAPAAGTSAAKAPAAGAPAAKAPVAGTPAAGTPAAKSAPAAGAPVAKAAPATSSASAAKAAPAPAARPAPVPPPPGAPTGERLVASPLARRLAGDSGLDIRTVAGSGPGGRIIKRDIAKALLEQMPAAAPPPGGQAMAAGAPPSAQQAAAARAPAAAPAPAAAAPSGAGDETVPLSMMRRAVARRLTEAKQTVPHFYLTGEAPMDALWHFREDLNRAAVAAGGEKVSVNDFILKALARALRVVPAANMSFGTDGVSAIRYNRVDISVAVAMDDGLITPVIRHADTKSLGALAKEVKELAGRGRDKKLRPDEYTGGTFSLTNLGMYGIREFYAIVNPPEAGILAVGQVEKRPVVVEIDGEDEVRVERRLTLTLSCDHRVIDGALGAKLLAEIVRGLANPMLLVL